MPLMSFKAPKPRTLFRRMFCSSWMPVLECCLPLYHQTRIRYADVSLNCFSSRGSLGECVPRITEPMCEKGSMGSCSRFCFI